MSAVRALQKVLGCVEVLRASDAAPHLGMCAEGFQSRESGKQNLGMTLSWSSASLESRDDFSN